MSAADTAGADERMLELAREIYPLCRSVTGDGVRDTLRAVGERVPLAVHEVSSGTAALDWTVPDEWNIRDAYVARPGGERIVDFRASNLHVVSYSEPVDRVMTADELRPHLHTHAGHGDWIPYRTSYYSRTWGFCVTRAQLDALSEGDFHVVVDSTLAPGSLTYGELVIPGERAEEVLLTTHVCHPSLANDNVSGVALLTELGARLAASPRRLSYRLLFIPGTIGSITWLSLNEDRLANIVAGVVTACVGDAAPLTYKRTRRSDALVDRAAAHVLRHLDERSRLLDFEPWGWDERQFNSPGYDLPVGCLTRSREGEFEEYHSSADSLEIVDGAQLEEALEAALAILDVLEHDARYMNLSPRGEPQLGKRNLYPTVGGAEAQAEQLAMLWVLNQSDGDHSLLDVAERSGLAFAKVREAARALAGADLLAKVDESVG